MGPRDDLDWCGKSRPHRNSIPGPSSPQRVAIPTELSMIKPGRVRWADHLARVTYRGRRDVQMAFWGRETEGKRPLGRPRPRWEDNIEIDLLRS